MKTALCLALAGLGLFASVAHAVPYKAASRAVKVTLPKDAYARRWNAAGGNGLVIPTYHPNAAPDLISVNGREYRRNSFNYTRAGERTFMAYTETAESSMSRRQAEYDKQEAQNRRNSW